MALAESLQKVQGRTSETSRITTQRPPGRETSETHDSHSLAGKLLFYVVTGLSVWIAYKVATGKYYTPRSSFGFYLGVVGSLLMVALLAYPLRKHVRWMHRWGALKHWFRIHMILGIVGPTLVLFHSTFHIRSTNAAVALFSMLGVVISGIIGRFVYTKIHYGLYGSRATLETLQEEFAGQSADTKSRLHFAPRVEQWLQSFRNGVMHTERSFLGSCWHFVTIGWTRRLYEWRCARELRKMLKVHRRPEFPGGAREAIDLVSAYLHEAERVAHFSAYERFFSLWHVLHIPLIYLLAASTIVHVIAVYMY